jgi:hypothetical protein
MATDRSKGLEPNPNLKQVLAPGADNVAIMRGFIGPSERDGYIRLFASLSDTSTSVEIAKADIVNTGDVLNNHLGKRIVWIRKGARITVTKTRTTEYGVRPKVPADPLHRAVRAGRLYMQMSGPEPRDTCVCICDCSTCECHCTNWCGTCVCLPQSQ